MLISTKHKVQDDENVIGFGGFGHNGDLPKPQQKLNYISFFPLCSPVGSPCVTPGGGKGSGQCCGVHLFSSRWSRNQN